MSEDLRILVEQGPPIEVLVEEEDQTASVLLPPQAAAITISVPGPAGPRGPAGELVEGTGDLHYTHVQGVPSATWEILHGLGKYPSITFVDSSGQEVQSDVEYVNEDYARGHHSAPFSGEAHAN